MFILIKKQITDNGVSNRKAVMGTIRTCPKCKSKVASVKRIVQKSILGERHAFKCRCECGCTWKVPITNKIKKEMGLK